jgi:hypothetical protein
MLVKRKVWVGISMVAGAAAMAQVVVAAGDEEYPGGKFSDALKMVLAGEGGEGGIGLSKMRNRSVSIPALKESQVSEALRGNTLRRDESYALHFDANGTFTGWEIRWDKVAVSRCTKDAGEAYEMEDGECWHATDVKIPQGKWSTRDGMLCTEPAMARVAEGEKCVTVFLVLDDIAVFNAKGDMIGKGSELVSGKHLEEVYKKAE